MWLNEGFTVFCERHVTNELEKAQKPEFAKVEAFLGNASMVSDMRNYGFDNSFKVLGLSDQTVGQNTFQLGVKIRIMN